MRKRSAHRKCDDQQSSLDEQLFGLDEYLRDLGWTTTKVRPGITDDEVVNLAKENEYVVVTLDKASQQMQGNGHPLR
jgi:predicted nuclease of predicted toxin-antitoxin system